MPSALLLQHLRRESIAALVCSVFAFSAPAATASTRLVTNCANAGAGSLRDAVTSAINNDVVDASGLNGVCSTISLTTGDVATTASNVTIKGPGLSKLTVTGKYGTFPNTHTEPFRILTHNGFGTLTLQGMTLSNGDLSDATGVARGGCLYSKGNVALTDVELSSCSANTTSGVAKGGGVYANGFLQLVGSTVKYCSANGGTSGLGVGGGAYVLGSLGATSSTIRTNSASGGSGNAQGSAGGILVLGPSVAIAYSTIANNTAGMNIGGIGIRNSAGVVTISNSTISGNTAATGSIGGVYVSANAQYILNSTIAFNTAATSSGAVGGAGASLYASAAAPMIVLQSTLIANNTYGAAVNKDLTAIGATIGGSRNLVRAPSASVPGDTIVGACPLLAPLRANDGPTLTHALRSHSRAIDTGSNNSGLQFDQRGSPFARMVGPPGTASPLADIGAYEVNQADVIFDADFEGCP